MAEDQGVNGDIWNDQAIRLLKAFNWGTIGDSNMDLINDSGDKHGVDRLAIYKESFKTDSHEIAVVEAKRYKTTSFKNDSLDNWVKTLDTKITNLKNSPDFKSQFPQITELPFRTGIIMAWFHNTDDYKGFRETFITQSKNIKLIRKPSASQNKIYVFENDTILKLSSLNNIVAEINKDHKLRFYYPSFGSYPIRRSEVLNPNYMFSKFILAEYLSSDKVENKVVFYFGPLSVNGFSRLQQALFNFNYIDEEKPLTIYTYQRDDEFRKIQPVVKSLFNIKNEQILPMEIFRDLPKFLL